MVKILYTLCLLLLMSYCTTVHAQSSANASFAIYNKKTGAPQYLIYAESVKKSGDDLNLTNVMIDIIRPKLKKISSIVSIAPYKIYDIKISKKNALKFWLKIPHSQGIIQAPKAVYNETFQLIKGKGPIHLRTPALDLDGVGFEADNNKKTLWIKSKVKVIFRFGVDKKLTKEAGATK
jgi:hypothetical protein